MSGQPKFVQLPTPDDLDIISDLKFSPVQNHLLASSWDKRILLYDCSNVNDINMLTHFNSPSPVLSIAYGSGNCTYVGCLDGTIKEIDYENLVVGNENLGESPKDDAINNGINNLCRVPNQDSFIISSSINGKLQLIDTRKRRSVFTKQFSSKIFCMDSTKDLLTLSLQSNKIEIYDLRNLKNPIETRDIGLKYQVKDLRSYPNGEGFALSTIDGRVSMEYFDSSPEVQATKRFTFKCHRTHDKLTSIDYVYPVNSIIIHKQFNTLFSAGSDGSLCLWDCEKRKRIRLYPKFISEDGKPASIVKIDLNHKDRLISVATSDDGYKNLKSLSEDSLAPKFSSKIYVRVLGETECMPKR